jgi:predicted DNA-binding transcriptional regulator AlpA
MKLIDFKSLGPLKGINYSRDHLRRKCKAGEFPEPISISSHRIAWFEEDLDRWLGDKAQQSANGRRSPPLRKHRQGIGAAAEHNRPAEGSARAQSAARREINSRNRASDLSEPLPLLHWRG